MNMIKCKAYDYYNNKWGSVEVTVDLDVYPCCFYYYNMQKSFDSKKVPIEKIKKIYEDELFTEINSDSPNPTCKYYCSSRE